MKTRTMRVRPGLEIVEDRCLAATGLGTLVAPRQSPAIVSLAAATQAVITFRNDTNGTIYYQFRWSQYNNWTNYSLPAHTSRWHWTTNSTSLSPQVRYDWSYSPGYQERIYSLGYNLYSQGGSPPSTAGKLYAFQAAGGGITVYRITGGGGGGDDFFPLHEVFNGTLGGYVSDGGATDCPGSTPLVGRVRVTVDHNGNSPFTPGGAIRVDLIGVRQTRSQELGGICDDYGGNYAGTIRVSDLSQRTYKLVVSGGNTGININVTISFSGLSNGSGQYSFKSGEGPDRGQGNFSFSK